MPTLPEIFKQLSVFVTAFATVAVILTAGVIVVVKDWRVSLLALAVQYVVVGLLLASEIQMELAVIKTLVGAILCLILYMTARHVDWGHPAPPRPPAEDEDESAQAPASQWTLPTELPFRLLAALLVMVAAYGGASTYPLPDVGEAISPAVYTLAALGLLALGLTDEPLKAGLGLLTFFSAFELLYTVLEPSLAVVGFLGLANLLTALAIAYLTVARAASLAGDALLGKAQPGPGGVKRFRHRLGQRNVSGGADQ